MKKLKNWPKNCNSLPGSFIENCQFFKVFSNNWIPQFFDYDYLFIFPKNPNRKFFDFGICKKGFFESGCSKIEFRLQLCPNLGFKLLHESYFISKSWMVHKSFAQMKSNK